MIIHCPACNKRISSRYDKCPNCKVALDEEGEGLDAEHVSARLAMEKRHKVQTQMYIALFILVGGAIWSWAASEGMTREPGPLPIGFFAGGAIWYIGLRVYMIYSKFRGSKR